MLTASFKKYSLQFKTPVLTSRGSMTHKNGYYIELTDGAKKGIGECSYIEGLSIDRLDDYETTLHTVCQNIANYLHAPHINLTAFPSIAFGIETALLDFNSTKQDVLLESNFTKGLSGISINGLIWMGNKRFMLQQVQEKIAHGYKCIKLKVGALDFATELKIIESIRKEFSKNKIELRIDANGAFNATDVFTKLKALAQFGIHSVEQPVKPKQYELMHEVCAANIMDVALDEELIGVCNTEERTALLEKINPQYIILKPSLLGGIASCNEWIEIAHSKNIAWWATSALESNIGLNAIAQWAFTKHPAMPQGLGTGGLFINNTTTKLHIKEGNLWFNLPNSL
jgi:o-succinylbenzoate synthase